jgi:phosphoglycerate kinase
VILASHLGCPKDQVDAAFSLQPVAIWLQQLLWKPVQRASDCVGKDIEARVQGLDPEEVLLLENVRFHAQEEANDPAFAEALARLGEVYVNDAFGATHRAHASTAGIARYLQPAVAGLLMEHEITYFSKATVDPEQPFVAILGSAKVSDKLTLMIQPPQ